MAKPHCSLLLVFIATFWCANAYASNASLTGDWVGGIDFEKWQPITLHFVADNPDLSATLDLPNQNRTGLALAKAVVKKRQLHIEWQSDSGPAIFEGLIDGDQISGSFTQGTRTAPFGLVHVVKIDSKLLDDYSGSYQIDRDRFIDIGQIGDAIKFIDSQTRDSRYLYPSSDTKFVSGPSMRIPFPIELTVRFIRDKGGTVSGLTWQEKNQAPKDAKRIPFRKENVTYRSGEATLTATLLVPDTKESHPALIDVGEGYFLGPDNGPDQYFYVRQGLAMMTPIRRVVGGAESNYIKASFEERAREAIAAVDFLKSRPDVNASQIGLYGDSQTAWIAPLAATYSRDVAFVILRVPSALPVTDNILYEIESNLRRDNFSENDIAHALALRKMIHHTILTNSGWQELKAEIDKAKPEQWFPLVRAGWFFSLTIPPDEVTWRGLRDPLTYDPGPTLESLKIPVLAFNAELDEAVPTKESVPIFERAMRKAGNKDFTIIVLPRAGHNFLETSKPFGAEEFVRKKRYVAGYWDALAAWLRRHLDLKHQG